jgi:4-carboxymuconolactone decarboxylase
LVTISNVQAAENRTLSAKQEKIIPIAAFTATGNLPKLETALSEGLDAGPTINEIKEILIHIYAYAGFPRALNGINTFMAVLDERKEQGITDKVGKEASPVPADFDKNAYGHKVRNEIVGRDISKRTSGYPVFTPIIDQFLVEHLFADIFYRSEKVSRQRARQIISPVMSSRIQVLIRNTGQLSRRDGEF